MHVDRLTRVNELLKREIGDSLFRVMHEQAFDLAAVSITRVITSRNLRQARVRVSIRAAAGEQARMLTLLSHHRQEIQQRINRDINIKYTPRLEFELDESIAEGDRVLHLISEMERAQPELPEQPAAERAAGNAGAG